MPRRGTYAIAAASAVALGALGTWFLLRDDDKPFHPPQGSLLCPGEVGRRPADASGIGAGDFVVVQLQSADGAFSESTWATVSDPPSEGFMGITLTGEQLAEGVRPLSTAKHGFRLGQKMVLENVCIWEVFRPKEHRGQILCGARVLELGEFLGDETLFPVMGGLTVQLGDRAQILVASDEASGTAWHEPLWTRIVTISSTGQVLTASVDDDPVRTEHGLSRGDVVRYNRDCVIGV